MRSRRKTTLPAEYDGALEMSQFQTGTPWRQMTITESFKLTKPKTFKMERPIVISSVSHVIDSDSDSETPPQFEFEGAASNVKDDPKMLHSSNGSMGSPSPPKRPKIMIGVYKPSTSTPKNNNEPPASPKLSTLGSPGNLNTPSTSNMPIDSPQSIRSNSSGKTIKYDYDASTNGIWDEETVPFPPDGEMSLPNKIGSQEILHMNYEESIMDRLSQNSSQESRATAIETNSKKKAVAKRLNFNGSENNSNATNKKEKKKRIKRNKSTDPVPQDRNSKNTGDITENFTTTAKKRRKTNKESTKIHQKANNTVKENSSPDENVSNRAIKAIITNIHSVTLTSPLGSSTNKTRSILLQNTLPSNASQTSDGELAMTSTEANGELPVIATETREDQLGDGILKKTDNLEKIVEKLRANQELSVRIVEESGTAPKNPGQPYVGTPVVQITPTGLPSTGLISKASVGCDPGSPSRRRLSNFEGSNIKVQIKPSNQTTAKTPQMHSTPNNMAESQNNLVVQSKPDTSDKLNQAKLDKTREEATPRKMVVDTQQPSCSKSPINETRTSQIKQNTSLAKQDTLASNKKNSGIDANNCTTPESRKVEPNTTPSKNTSPRRRLFGSPSKGSPLKSREIKTLKSKEGKKLQVTQMDKLMKLFNVAASNRHLRNLLNQHEREILKKFVNMEDNKKYFVMKLFVWQRQWYNIFQFCNKAKIECDDEKDIVDIFEYLREKEFVDTDYTRSASLPELLNTLDRFKVKEIMEERRIKPIKNKAENIKTILAVAGRQATLTSKSFQDLIMESIEKKMGFAIKIKEDVCDNLYHTYLLATFTNPSFYKVEDYFNNIIHLRVTFPKFPVEDYPVFYSRDKFLKYGQALKTRTNLEDQMTNKNKESKFLGLHTIAKEAYEYLYNLDTDDTNDHSEAPHLKRFAAQHVYTGILSMCCDKLYTKQNGFPNDVKKWLEYLIKKFGNSRRLGKWYQVLIRLHTRHLDNINYETAAKLLLEVLDSKKLVLGEIAIHDLGELGYQLKSSRKYKIDQMYHDRITQVIPRSIDHQSFPQQQIDSQCIRSDVTGKKRDYILKSSDGMTVRGVEQVALEHYAENGYPNGKHCEGSLVKALFMLSFWDIIYNPTKIIPGTFISDLQTAPLDMFTPHFYPNRKELIDERLNEIESEWSEEKLICFAAHNWRDHSHERAAFGEVGSAIEDEDTVKDLITVIGRKVLANIFKRLIKNIRDFNSGMPDLLVWNVSTKKCKFVEVKGEGDRLSTTQKLWLQHLELSGSAIEVCHVHSMGSKRKNIKKVHKEPEAQQNSDAGPSSRPDE